MVKCSFPYNGSKTEVAPVVWAAFGSVSVYIEPFFGSGAVLFNRPKLKPLSKEIINDKSGFISNFWRSVKNDPEAVAYYADLPVNENNYHAIHIKLVTLSSDLDRKLEGSFSFYDPEIAGYWLWGQCTCISGSWCNFHKGPWTIVDGKLIRNKEAVSKGGSCISRSKISTLYPHGGLYAKFQSSGKTRYNHLLHSAMSLANRLEKVIVLSGDWSRAISDGVVDVASNISEGVAIFFDPPYLGSSQTLAGYSNDESVEESSVAQDVFSWCLSHDSNPNIKIALCGYEGDYSFPSSWYKFRWHQPDGFNKESKLNLSGLGRECIFFSPSCSRIIKSMNLSVRSSLDSLPPTSTLLPPTSTSPLPPSSTSPPCDSSSSYLDTILSGK